MLAISYIPEDYQDGFIELFGIETKTFDAILDGLASAKPASSIKKISGVVSETKSIDIDLVEKIFSSAGSLISILEKGVPVNEISEGIYEAVNKKHLIKTNVTDEEDKAKFIKRLADLLEVKQLYYSSKAEDLINGHTNVFLNSKIITDFRPIFDLNIETSPSTGIIMHNLQVHYRGNEYGENHRDFFLSLDSADLKELKESIERAERKEKSLRDGLQNINFIQSNS